VDEELESDESETESEETSSEEDSTPFIEYDAEPLAKSRTQSRSTVRSVVDNADVQGPPRIPLQKSQSPLESKSPVSAVSERSPVASVSPVGRISQSSFGFPAVNTESGYTGKSLRSSVTALPEPSPVVSPVGRASQPSPVVNAQPAYAGKSQTSPAVQSPVLRTEPDYAGKSPRSPTVPVAYSDPGEALKFQRSPVANAEPAFAGKSRRSPNYVKMSPQLEYAEFDSEPMARNRRNIPYVDDDDVLSPAPLPGSPRKPSSPPVQTSTLVAPTSPLVITQPSYVQTFEASSVMVPRATAGPILMPPAVTEPTARIKASPVMHLNPVTTGSTSPDNRQTSQVPVGRVRPPSISRMSPVPPAPAVETGVDAVSQLFMKLETGYTNPPPASSQLPVRSQEPSYGPGYRPSMHGAVVRQQEPHPVEVQQLMLLIQ